MISLLGLLMVVCAAALIGGLIGGYAGACLVDQALPARGCPTEPPLDDSTASDIDMAADLWAAENEFPEARGLVADKLRLMARLRRSGSLR